MEFFEETNQINIDVLGLQELLTISNMPNLCSSITNVIFDNKVNGSIYCLWGEFDINREELDFGIRFSLPHCPNAFAWTITHDEDSDKVVIHCTINKQQHDAEFVESIEQFISDWEIN